MHNEPAIHHHKPINWNQVQPGDIITFAKQHLTILYKHTGMFDYETEEVFVTNEPSTIHVGSDGYVWYFPICVEHRSCRAQCGSWGI